MSIFRSSFKPYLQRQVNARQDIVSSEKRDERFQQYALGKNCWARMTSLVNYDSVDSTGKPDGKFKGSDLSKKYVLESGTLYFDQTKNQYALRRGVATKAGSYGGNLGDKQFGIRPMPGITSIDIKSKTAYGSLREAEVRFFAWDKGQMEDLEILFMRWGYSVLLEFGWSLYLDTFYDDLNKNNDAKSVGKIPISQVKTKNFNDPTINAFDEKATPEKIYAELEFLRHKYSGNYDGMLGKIRNFSWTMLPGGGFECVAIIISIGDILDSLKINSSTYPFHNNDKDATNAKDTDNSRLLTRFEQIFTAIIELDRNYIVNNVIGSDRLKKYQKDPTKGDFDPNVDFGIYPITFNSVPSTLFDKGHTNTHQSLHYISMAAFIAIMDTQFNLYDPKNNLAIPMLDIEPPYPGYGTYGNGLCLCSEDTVSIDPEVCLIFNPNAKFVTNLASGFSPKSLNKNSASFNPFNYQGEKNVGIIGNIYLCAEYIINKFRGMSNGSDGYVDMKKFIEEILKDVSYSLGGINEFGFFVLDSSVAIVDTHFVEDSSSRRVNKFVLNMIGSNSVIREFNITSKIFASQATMVAIGAGVRENIAAVQSSTYNYLNKGLTDRVFTKALDADAVASLKGSDGATEAKQDEKYKTELARMVYDLQNYVQSYLVKGDLSQVNMNRQAANSALNSLILKVNTDANYKAIIPISAEITFDGIGGFTIGEIFKLNPDVLPREYVNKRLGMIVTGISHHIENSDWTTRITTMSCLLETNDIIVNNINKQDLSDSISNIVKQDQIVKNIEQQTQAIIYNNIIDLIVAIFGIRNQRAIDKVNSLRKPADSRVSPLTFTFTAVTQIGNFGIGEYVIKIPTINYVNYPASTFEQNFVPNIPHSIFDRENTIFKDAKIKSDVRTTAQISIAGSQYVLNPLDGHNDNVANLVRSLCQNHPQYNQLTEENKNIIIKICDNISKILKGDPEKTGRTVVLNRLDDTGTFTTVIPIDVSVIASTKF